MRAPTVRKGIKLQILAVSLLIAGSFYHEQISDIFRLSDLTRGQFAYFSIFGAGMVGGFGILVMIVGLVRAAVPDQVRLAPTFLLLLLLVSFFFMLLYKSITSPDQTPRLRPGETVII